MPDRDKVIKAIDICLGHGKCDDCGYRIKGGYSTMDCRKPMMRDALDLLKEQEEQKWKWFQTIADTQLAISPTGYESEDELAKRGWEWNGLQMAWEIIAGEERSEHPRLVRCKDCENACITSDDWVICTHIDSNGNDKHPVDWFCADGERKEGR